MEERSEGLLRAFEIIRIVLIYVWVVFLMVLNASSIAIFDIGNITPFFLLMGIYYWVLTRPSLFPSYIVFAFALGLDIISGQPIGLNAFSFMVVYFLLNGQRRFLSGQSWSVMWVGFGLACALVAFLHMLVFILMNWSWPGILPLLATVLSSVLAYPLIAMPMIGLNRIFR